MLPLDTLAAATALGWVAIALGIVWLTQSLGSPFRAWPPRWLPALLIVAGCLLASLAPIDAAGWRRHREEHAAVALRAMAERQRPLFGLGIRIHGPNPLHADPDGTTLTLRMTDRAGLEATSQVTPRGLRPTWQQDGEFEASLVPWTAVVEGAQSAAERRFFEVIARAGDFERLERIQVEVHANPATSEKPDYLVLDANGDSRLELFSAGLTEPKGATEGAAAAPGLARFIDSGSPAFRVGYWEKSPQFRRQVRKDAERAWAASSGKAPRVLLWMALVLAFMALAPQIPATVRMVPWRRALDWCRPLPRPGTDALLRESLDRLDRRAAALALVLTVAAFHAMTVGLLVWYYRNHLPHFDSVGSYTFMAQVTEITRSSGWLAGLRYASQFHLSWLQGMFAVLVAPVLPSEPAGFQLLNTLCVALFQFSVYLVARELGASRAKAFVASLVVFLPDVLSNWDGGMQDMKRDAQFLALLGASVFLSLAQVWNPNRRRGLLLGVILGLTVWSRGNALAYLVIILAPIYGFVIARAAWRREFRPLYRMIGPPFLVGALVAVPNLARTFRETFARHSDPTLHYGHDGNIWSSLAYYGWAPWELWSTRTPTYGANETTFLVGRIILGVWCLSLVGLFGPRISLAGIGRPRVLGLVLAGAWAVVGTIILICCIVGWDPRFGYSGMPPFYPALLGPMAALAALTAAIHVPQATGKFTLGARWAGALAISLACIGALGARMWLKAGECRPDIVAMAESLWESIRAEEPGACVASLTHDRVNFHLFRYLEARGHFDPNRRLTECRFTLPGDPRVNYFDTASVLPESIDVTSTQEAYLEQILEKADYIIVNTSPEMYDQPPGPWNFFLFRHGAPIARALLANENLTPMREFRLGKSDEDKRDYVVLRNKHRLARARERTKVPLGN